MADVILMPRLSDTMTEGVIAAWHKNVGDPVKKGDILAEVETDKATMELESYKDGTLLHIGTAKGGKLQVNDLLAVIGQPGEDISSYLHDSTTGTASMAESSSPVATTAAEKKEETTPQVELPEIPGEVVLMPRLSDTMEAGVIAAWHKNVGDKVKKGDILAEIETDKATMELESYKNGTLLYIGSNKGEKIPVNGLLCIIGEKGNLDVEAIVARMKKGTAAVTEKTESDAAKTETNEKATGNGRIKASPLAKRLAEEKGIDLKILQGSGDGGRIIKADIDNYQLSTHAAQKPGLPLNAAGPAAPNTEEGYTDIPNSQMRAIIARRLAESKFNAPHFYLKMEIRMDQTMQVRTQLNELTGEKTSFNDILIKAAALALRSHPAANASWMGDKIRRYKHIHIGMAVAVEDGLLVPVIRFADQKTLLQIAAESKELATKAKNKKLNPDEFKGNTFTISNLGMMDIDEFTAIINPPDSCIMAVGRIKEVVVRENEQFSTAHFMTVTLSCDHRAVDGATGAAFLQTFKKYLENPVSLLIQT